MPRQGDIRLNGNALQCRITTEDPEQNFIPDYGRITAYRGATGFGIRLDGGTAYSGAVITRFYDPLLEKVTAWAPTAREAIARMDRALREFRIRGVATNLTFLENIIGHPKFRDASYTTRFIDRASEIYGYGNFVCDSGGSICEVVDPDDPADPVLRELSDHLLMVWIEGSDAHTDELVRRFRKAPKPMYYRTEFMVAAWESYLADRGVTEEQVDPDDFMAATYARAMAHRQPLYAAMARNWGVTVTADEIAGIRDAADFEAVIAAALEKTAA